MKKSDYATAYIFQNSPNSFQQGKLDYFLRKKKLESYHFFAHHPKFFLWLLWLKIQRLISRFITSFMLKFMLNYAICNSEANRTIVKLIAKQLKCMKKRSQYIERRVHTIPLPPKYKLEKKISCTKYNYVKIQAESFEFWTQWAHALFTEGKILLTYFQIL